MLNENMAGGGHVAGTSGGIVSSSSGVTLSKTPVPIPSSGLQKTTVAPSAASTLKVPNSGLAKSTVVPQSSSTVIDPAFLADHVKPGSGDLWLTKEDYAKLSPAEQQAYNTGGYSALQSYWTANNIATASQSAADQAQFDATYQTPGAGDQYITKSDYNKLSKAEQQAYTTGGYAALQSYWTVQTTTYNDSPDVKSAKQRITDLQQDITNAQNDIANNQNPWDDPASNPALQQEIQTDTAIINILQSYINAQQPIPTNISTIASTTMIPYVTVNADGTLDVDVTHAASIGVDPKTLKAAGATDGQISTGQALHDLALYAVSGGGIDIDRAVAAGVPDATLKAAGFQDSDISTAKSVNATMAILNDPNNGYKTSTGYQVAQAVADGKITKAEANQAGFNVSDNDVTTATATSNVMNILNKSYKNSDGTYNVTQAVADGKITLDQANSAGFDISKSDVDTTKSIDATMSILNKGYLITTGASAGDSPYDIKTQSTYNVGQAILDGKITKAQALAAGFQESAIDASIAADQANAKAKATSAAASSGATPSTTDIMTEISSALADPKQTQSGRVSALNDALDNDNLWNNTVFTKAGIHTTYLGGQTFYVDAKGHVLTQQDQVKLVWNSLTADQKQTVAGDYAQDLYRTNPFSETVKQIAEAGQEGGLAGQMAVAPLTGLVMPIAKAASGQKVTKQDIGNAVLTAVGDAMMMGGGDALENLGTAGKVISKAIIGGMGAVGIDNTIMQMNAGNTPASSLAVEGALAVYMTVSSVAGLVTQFLPKNTPKIDVAQQYVNDIGKESTAEGLMKTPTVGAPLNNNDWADTSEEPTDGNGLTASNRGSQSSITTGNLKNWTPTTDDTTPEVKSAADNITSLQDEIKTQDLKIQTLKGQIDDDATPAAEKVSLNKELVASENKLDDLNSDLDDANETYAKTKMSEFTYRAANNSANFADYADAANKYAQNEYDINKLTQQIAEKKTLIASLDRDEMPMAKDWAESDLKQLQGNLSKLQDQESALEKNLTNAETKFNTEFKQYLQYCKDNDLVNGQDTGNELDNLRSNSAKTIKANIDLMMNGDNSPEAIAAQQSKVDALEEEYKNSKSSDIEATRALRNELADAKSKLAAMKIGNLEQMQNNLTAAREEVSDIQEIMKNAKKLSDTQRQALVNTQAQLESQINEFKGNLNEQVIQGHGLSDVQKTEMIYRDPVKGVDDNMSSASELKEQIQDALKSGDKQKVLKLQIALAKLATGARIYTNDGVFTVPLDKNGNPEPFVNQDEVSYRIDEKTGKQVKMVSPRIKFVGEEESQGGGGGRGTVPVEAPPASPDTITPEQAELQQTSRGMPKAGAVAAGAEAISSSRVETPSKTQDETQTKNPSKTPAKVPYVNPDISPKVNPDTEKGGAVVPDVSKSGAVQPDMASKTLMINASKAKVIQPNSQKRKTGSVEMSKAQAVEPQIQPLQIQSKQTKSDVKSVVDVQTDTPVDDENNAPPLPTTPPPANMTQKQIRTYVKDNKGAIAWNQGALYGKRRWDIILYPYTQKGDHLIVFGKAPKGATIVNGVGSAFRTAKVLYGKAPDKSILVSGTGFEKLVIAPETGGKGISLHYTPITDHKPAISGKKSIPTEGKGNIEGKGRVFPLGRRTT